MGDLDDDLRWARNVADAEARAERADRIRRTADAQRSASLASETRRLAPIRAELVTMLADAVAQGDTASATAARASLAEIDARLR